MIRNNKLEMVDTFIGIDEQESRAKLRVAFVAKWMLLTLYFILNFKWLTGIYGRYLSKSGRASVGDRSK